MGKVTATNEEKRASLPGDDLLRNPFARFTHGIDIAAPPDRVWPWLVQIGADRAGWYSYDLIDNGGRPSASTLLPDHQTLAVGDLVPALPGATDAFIVAAICAPQYLVLDVPTPDGNSRASWALVLRERRQATRLLARASLGYRPFGLPRLLLGPIAGQGHHIMQRKQLIEIRRRAECNK